MPENNFDNEEHHHFEEGIKLIFRGLIPLALLASGICILALRLPGWSIIFGLPMVVFGVVFLIYTYDEVVSTSFSYNPKELIKCSVCGKPTPRLPRVDVKQTVCFRCQEKGI